jgi:aryl-alcohol dehydrogenase-like predicted oxidoreductase
MEYASFGKTGIRVSRLCLGTMTFGNEADEDTSRAIMDRCMDAGVNFFDTANIYNKGVSEEIIGRWMGGKRESVILASKAHGPTGDGPNDWGSSRRNIMLAVEKSLKRLKTDWLDILYLHLWDDSAALEQSLAAVDALIRQGKVVYCGVSNFAAWQIMKAVSITEAKNLAPVACIQPMYNLVKRQVEVEIFPMAMSEGIAVCPYNPLAAGVLTGKYLRGESGRINVNDMYKKRYANPMYPEIAKRFVDHAESIGRSPAPLALAWVMSHPAITSTIIGARNLVQLNDCLGCLEFVLSSEERAAITALSIDPPLPTDR